MRRCVTNAITGPTTVTCAMKIGTQFGGGNECGGKRVSGRIASCIST